MERGICKVFLAAAASTLAAAAISSTAVAVPIYVVDDNPGQHLITFDSANPTLLNTSYAISGLQPNEKLIGIDFRISASGINQGVLYGLGSFGRIYTLNTATGMANYVASLTNGVTPVILNGTEFGVDFNPQADLLRVTSDLDQNLAINVDTGATSVQTNLNPGNPNVTDLAYDRNDQSAGTPTTLFGIDTVANQLVRVGGVDGTPNPSTGTVTPVGPLGLVNAISIGGFDIDSSGAGTAFAALRPAASTDSSILYTINLGTGTATPVGSIGNAEDALVIKGLTVGPGPGVPEPATLAIVGISAASLLATRRGRV